MGMLIRDPVYTAPTPPPPPPSSHVAQTPVEDATTAAAAAAEAVLLDHHRDLASVSLSSATRERLSLTAQHSRDTTGASRARGESTSTALSNPARTDVRRLVIQRHERAGTPEDAASPPRAVGLLGADSSPESLTPDVGSSSASRFLHEFFPNQSMSSGDSQSGIDGTLSASLPSLAALLDAADRRVAGSEAPTARASPRASSTSNSLPRMSTSRPRGNLIQTVLSSPLDPNRSPTSSSRWYSVPLPAVPGSTSLSATVNPPNTTAERAAQTSSSSAIPQRRDWLRPPTPSWITTIPSAYTSSAASRSPVTRVERDRFSSFRERILASTAAGRSAENDAILRSARQALQLAVSYAERLEEATRALTERVNSRQDISPALQEALGSEASVLSSGPVPPTAGDASPPSTPPAEAETEAEEEADRAPLFIAIQRSIEQLRAASAQIDQVLGDEWEALPRREESSPDETRDAETRASVSDARFRDIRERSRRRQAALLSELDAASGTTHSSSLSTRLNPFGSHRPFMPSSSPANLPGSTSPSFHRHAAVRNLRPGARPSSSAQSSSAIHVTIDPDTLAESRLADEMADRSDSGAVRRQPRAWIKLDRNGDEVEGSEDEVDPSGFRKGSTHIGR